MHFLSLAEVNSHQISGICDLAGSYQNQPTDATLSGKTAVLFFSESSIRTRITFEKAVWNLGGQSILFPPSALEQKEELKDVAGYLANWVDIAIIRHPSLDIIRSLARHAPFPIINAMTTANHPCEILGDYFGIRSLEKDQKHLRLTFVGPSGNILRSWTNLAAAMGFTLVHVCREGERVMDDSPSYVFTSQLEESLENCDVLLTDPLPPEFQDSSYLARYQITRRHVDRLPNGSLFNPCPPFSRGEEISDDALNSEAFVGYEFKRSLLHVHQAIIRFCLENSSESSDAVQLSRSTREDAT